MEAVQTLAKEGDWPGDIVLPTPNAFLAVPPQLVADVIKDAETTVYTENFKREICAAANIAPAISILASAPNSKRYSRNGRKHTRLPG